MNVFAMVMLVLASMAGMVILLRGVNVMFDRVNDAIYGAEYMQKLLAEERRKL